MFFFFWETVAVNVMLLNNAEEELIACFQLLFLVEHLIAYF